jgi:glycosyltransferase involved in cell wall biosynthesis
MFEMSCETALREDARKRVEKIGQADILVGIPSYNNAATIGHVVRMAAQGMVEYFPDMRPVLVNSDGGSLDSTRQVVLNTPVPQGVEVMATEYQGIPGKGCAFRSVFEAAEALGVKVCVVVDSDLRSITPEWIELLARPIVAKDPAAKLGPMFRQVVGTLFGMMAKYEPYWKAVTSSQPTPIYGAPKEVESQDMDSATFEREVIQAQARTFEELKSRLIECWDISYPKWL